MITPGYSPTATERVLPRMALDFTTASLDSRVTVTRALNTATRTNSSGLVEIVNANLPRFDYDPVTLVCKGLLIEESRINRVQYSEDFNSWTKTEVTVNNTSDVTAPDGTLTADKLIANTANATHLVSQTGLSSSVSVLSFYARAAEETVVSGWLGGAAVGASFNLTTGVASSQGATSFDMYPVGNGWYRCWVYWATATTTAHIYMRTGGGFTGNGTSGLYLWGAQLEAGAFVTSYIPNLATGTTTRNMDVVTMTGTNFSSWYNANEGAFAVDFDSIKPAGNLATVLAATDNPLSNDWFVMFCSTGTSINRVRYNGTDQCDLSISGSTSGSGKIVLAYKTNNFAASFNGSAVAKDTGGTVPTDIVLLRIGAFEGVTTVPSCANGAIKRVRYWPQCLTDNEVQALSK